MAEKQVTSFLNADKRDKVKGEYKTGAIRVKTGGFFVCPDICLPFIFDCQRLFFIASSFCNSLVSSNL
jgi:hypothetical protein